MLQVGADWLLLHAGAHDVLVPAHAVVGVEGVGPATEPPRTARWRRTRGRLPGGCSPATGRGCGWCGPAAARCTGSRCGSAPTSWSSTPVHEGGPAASVLVPYAAITAAYVPAWQTDGA